MLAQAKVHKGIPAWSVQWHCVSHMKDKLLGMFGAASLLYILPTPQANKGAHVGTVSIRDVSASPPFSSLTKAFSSNAVPRKPLSTKAGFWLPLFAEVLLDSTQVDPAPGGSFPSQRGVLE
eukprot:scaffold271_cov336-Pavlova_lutheri.AAC.52